MLSNGSFSTSPTKKWEMYRCQVQCFLEIKFHSKFIYLKPVRTYMYMLKRDDAQRYKGGTVKATDCGYDCLSRKLNV